MADQTKIQTRLLKTLPFAAVLALVLVLALAKIDDTDVWWHMKCGELFLRKGWIPRQEIFSYTAQGAPWVDGYLLAQAIYYISWLTGGPAGVILLGAMLVTGTYALSFRMSAHGPGYYMALAAAAPAAYLSINCNFPRPALLTPLFSVITLYLLEDFRKRDGWRIWWLIPLMVLWVNCHPAFFLGPAITAIYLLGTLQPERPPGDGQGKKGVKHGHRSENYALEIAHKRKQLAKLLVAEALATLVNPYGPGIYYTVLLFTSDPRIKEVIIEWAPIYYNPPHVIFGVIPAFVILTLIAVLALSWSGRRARLERALLFIFMAVSAFTGRRNLMLFAVITLPIISWTVSDVVVATGSWPLQRWINGGLPGRILRGAVSLAMLVMIWFVSTDRFYFYVHLLRNTGFTVQTDMFPEKASELLKSEHVQGNIFHQFVLGGFFIFELYPQYRVYIDGRTYPYPFEVFQESRKALTSPATFEKLKERYDVRAVFLAPLPDNVPLMEYLLKSRAWAAVYADSAGALFLLRGAGNDAMIQRHEINLLADPPILPTRPPGRKYRPWSKAENPYGIMQWGMTYEKIGRPDLTLRVLKEALNYRPLLKDMEINVGALMIKSGELDGGYNLIQRVLGKYPDHPVALRSLADYYIRKSDWEQAEKVLLKLLKDDPKSENLWHGLGAIAFNKKDYVLSAQRFQNAIALSPDSPVLWEKLGRSLEYINIPEAARAYRKAIELLQSSGASPGDVQRVHERLEKLGGG